MISDSEGIRLIFGLKLKALRQQQGMNYQALSEATGIAVSYLHDIENGKKYPKADKIIILAKALNVDYDYLVSLTAKKRLQPVIDFMNSDFTSTVPWEHFGITPASLLSMFANMPDKITAFVSTILKRSRRLQTSNDTFYTSALRSYQDLHDNYFEDLEKAVVEFREHVKLKIHVPLELDVLEKRLLKLYDVKVDRKGMSGKEEIKYLRSFYAEHKKILYVNKGLTNAQEKFLLGRELAFQHLKLSPRPYETNVQSLASFEILLHNFNASYFSNALLMPEKTIIEDIHSVFASNKWSSEAWLDLVAKYDVTPEMLMQRLTNILPKHFGIEQLFFLRMRGEVEKDYFEITKELHLSQFHNPYANDLQEHYCRRWLAIDIMKDVDKKVKEKKFRKPLIHAQISEYWQTDSRYFCITFAKPHSADSDVIISVTLGLLIDQNLIQKVPLLNDPSIPVKTVHTTCERCGIMDCKERAGKPIIIEQQEKIKAIEETLQKLDQN